MALDSALRKVAIPFLAQVAGYNRNEQSDFDITKCDNPGDLRSLTQVPGDGIFDMPKHNLVRMMTPQFVAVMAAYLAFSLTFANSEPSPKFYLTVGTGYTDSGVNPAVPTQSEIVANHTLLKGDSQPWTTANGLPGTVTIDKLNILKLLPGLDDDKYREGIFVVGVHFLQQPVFDTGWKLTKFEVNCSGVIVHG